MTRKFQTITGVYRKHSLANVVYDWSKQYVAYCGDVAANSTTVIYFPTALRLLGFALYVDAVSTVTITLNASSTDYELYESSGEECCMKMSDSADDFIETYGSVTTTDYIKIEASAATFLQFGLIINEVA